MKVENSNSRQMREGSIARFWRTRQDAESDAEAIRRGEKFYKDTGLRYFDPVIVEAEAYYR